MASRTPVDDRIRGAGPDLDGAHVGTGALATDALEPWEVVDLTEHLEHCRWCRQEAVEFGETTAELTRLTATPAPEQIRTAVLREILTVRQLPPIPRRVYRWDTRQELEDAERKAISGPPRAGRSRTGRPGSRRSGSGRSGSGRSGTRRSGPGGAGTGRAGSGRVARIPARLVAGLIATIAVLAGFGAVTVHGELRDRAQQRVAEASAVQSSAARTAADRQETMILAAPDARVVNRRMPDGSTLTFLLSQSRNAALVVTAGLSDPGPGRTYQLWTAVGSGRSTRYLPDRTFGSAEGQRVLVSGDVRDASALAVTVERAGGALTPDGPPVAVVTL